MAERLKEAEMDNRDRLKEKEEIEELKNRIFSGEHEDPNAEFERVSEVLRTVISELNFIFYLRRRGSEKNNISQNC